ncbi:DUF4112 domain-containing protein [Aromatoleum aromaticum]|nr:DUF4112 domain-containing protein [Aromatoleum aromaticum]NMG55464.1 DUF4112 domain-containing protein [Aromatoleum aromaticum]
MKGPPGVGREPFAASREGAHTREKLRALAWLLDSSIRLPGGFRIGVEALIGLVPFLGDAVGVLLSGYIVREAARLGMPRSVLLCMIGNVAIEGIVGVVPILGDVFDAAWKANQRNVQLLEQHVDDPAATTRSSRRLVALVIAGLLVVMLIFATISALIVKAILAAVGG